MLTRVEIDGFKSFEGFALDLPPFAVILGPNPAGKSNLFDALRLLSNLATMDVRSALRGLRGEPQEQFQHLPGTGPVERMRLAAHLLLPSTVRDAYGQQHRLTGTRWCYEVVLQRREIAGTDRVFVAAEQLVPIRKDLDLWRPLDRPLSVAFRKAFVRYTPRPTAKLETAERNGQPVFAIHQDGNAGLPREIPASAAETTVLSQFNTVSGFLHLYAVKEELRSLRFLQLDPAAERQPSPLDAPEMLEPDGANLAAVLYRIAQETRSEERPWGWLTDIRNDLAAIIPGILDLSVERDEVRREYRLTIETQDRQRFNARVASDGTLRVLALLALLNDPRHRGTLCFEEPENGVSPRRLARLMRYLRDGCAPVHDTDVEEDDPRALQQILVNTHSTVAAEAVEDQIVLADTVTRLEPGSPPRRLTRMRPVKISAQGAFDLEWGPRPVTHAELEQLLRRIEDDELAA